ncbi:hypothetical protein [Lentilactobacillus kosonis]|uniref:Uncharacterized protein n=1 Tax=Lentilactobacillus kosonis TaxID=2810561 RepID=A0A401FHU3_9LACO|nr:hypothetical protein [Lentilactobacillus kosonis]GAY71945.1 hypothetical protein NBRC111893_91 [Lentilactobacillus kosonis]
MTGIEALILSVINFIEIESNRAKLLENFETVMDAVLMNRIIQPDKNLNVVFYQYGMALLHQKKLNESINVLQNGVKWATDHDSNFMLADFFFMLAHEYVAINDEVHAKEADNNYRVISKVFNQNVNRSIN